MQKVDSYLSECLESIPLQVLGINGNNLQLRLSENCNFEVPLAVLPGDAAIIPKQLLLKIKKPDGSVFAADLWKERCQRLRDLIN